MKRHPLERKLETAYWLYHRGWRRAAYSDLFHIIDETCGSKEASGVEAKRQ